MQQLLAHHFKIKDHKLHHQTVMGVLVNYQAQETQVYLVPEVTGFTSCAQGKADGNTMVSPVFSFGVYFLFYFFCVHNMSNWDPIVMRH